MSTGQESQNDLDEVIGFVKEQLSQGASEEDIRSILKEQGGWYDSDLDIVFQSVLQKDTPRTENIPPETQTQVDHLVTPKEPGLTHRKKFIITAAIALILIVGGVTYSLLFLVTANKPIAVVTNEKAIRGSSTDTSTVTDIASTGSSTMAVVADPQSDWISYTNEYHKISLLYSKNWHIMDTPSPTDDIYKYDVEIERNGGGPLLRTDTRFVDSIILHTVDTPYTDMVQKLKSAAQDADVVIENYSTDHLDGSRIRSLSDPSRTPEYFFSIHERTFFVIPNEVDPYPIQDDDGTIYPDATSSQEILKRFLNSLTPL